jgi:hypothetical protein
LTHPSAAPSPFLTSLQFTTHPPAAAIMPTIVSNPFFMDSIEGGQWEVVNLLDMPVEVTIYMMSPVVYHDKPMCLHTFRIHLDHAHAQFIQPGHTFSRGILVTVKQADFPNRIFLENFPLNINTSLSLTLSKSRPVPSVFEPDSEPVSEPAPEPVSEP